MHGVHEHIGKGHHLSKLQSQNIIDPLTFIPPVSGALGRNGIHLNSTPQPMMVDPQFNNFSRGLNQGGANFNGFTNAPQDQFQQHNPWTFGYGQGS